MEEERKSFRNWVKNRSCLCVETWWRVQGGGCSAALVFWVPAPHQHPCLWHGETCQIKSSPPDLEITKFLPQRLSQILGYDKFGIPSPVPMLWKGLGEGKDPWQVLCSLNPPEPNPVGTTAFQGHAWVSPPEILARHPAAEADLPSSISVNPLGSGEMLWTVVFLTQR